MRPSLLLGAGLSLGLHALLFFALPAPRFEPPRSPAPGLSISLGAAGPTRAAGPSSPSPPREERPSAPALPSPPSPLPEAPIEAPSEPSPPGAPADPGADPSAEASPGPEAGAGPRGEDRRGPGSGAEKGGEGPPVLLDPAEGLIDRLEAFVEERKVYPEAARRRGSEGVVRLALVVDAEGRLRSIRRAASSGSALLDQAALELLRSAFPLSEGAGREIELVLAIRYELN